MKNSGTVVRELCFGQGQKRFTGGKDLKASQAYPCKFGEDLQYVFASHIEEVKAWAASIAMRSLTVQVTRADLTTSITDVWADAMLGSVMSWLAGKKSPV